MKFFTQINNDHTRDVDKGVIADMLIPENS